MSDTPQPPAPTDSQASIEVSIVNTPHLPRSPEPSRDDDPTGVRALLSSLPQPDPMPTSLVERINATLAAEQAQRAAGMDNDAVSPMVARTPVRKTRMLFAVAGAAAVVLVAVVSSIDLSGSQTTTTTIGAAIASTSSGRDSTGESAPNADANAPARVGEQLGSQAQPGSKAQSGSKAPPSPSNEGEFSGSEAFDRTGVARSVVALQIRQSGTRYTQAEFLAQAMALHQAALAGAKFQSTANVGPTSTTDWLRECLNAIGASATQKVEADIAFYEGRPAVIIVGFANGASQAYAVAPRCSHADPAILHPATSFS